MSLESGKAQLNKRKKIENSTANDVKVDVDMLHCTKQKIVFWALARD